MKQLLIIFLLAVNVVSCLQASPVYRIRKIVLQPDGTQLAVTRTGADHLLYYVTDDGMPVYPDERENFYYAQFGEDGGVAVTPLLAHEAKMRTPAEQAMADDYKSSFLMALKMRHLSRYGIGMHNSASVKSIGEVKVPVILAQFTDVSFQAENDIERFSKHFNASSYKEEGGAGSVRDYFIAQSDSAFKPQFDVLAKVTLSQPRIYYGGNSGGNDKNPRGYIAEAVDSAIAAGVDFTPYKNSKGDVFVVVIYPGHGEQVSGVSEQLWAAYYYTMSYTVGDLKFSSAMVMDELADYGNGEMFDGIGTFCHEFSHALGLPDLYNTNSLTGIFGMDAWSLMDYGQFNNFSRTPVGYTAYEREFMGWLKIDTLQNTKQLVELAPLHSTTGHRAYRILNEADISGNEYYLIENRQNSDWFLKLYGEGMLVMHVDYSASAWTSNTINNNVSHQRFTIIPADNVLTPLSNKASTYKGDPFPGYTGNTELSNTTTPAAVAYKGEYMNIRLKDIHEDTQNNIVFYYQCEGQLGMPTSLSVSNLGSNGFSISFAAVDNAQKYVLTLTKDGSVVRTDTISNQSFAYSQLNMASAYAIGIKAIADDYLDSSVAELLVGGNVGDVNRDGVCNSADVVSIYNYISNGEASGVLKYYADVNRDGTVNSADVIAVYNIIQGD